MQIIPIIGESIRLKKGNLKFDYEHFTYSPYLQSYISGVFTIENKVFIVNIFLENIDNTCPEIIYPKEHNVVDIYDYDISYYIQQMNEKTISKKVALFRIKKKFLTLLERKLNERLILASH